MRARLFFLVTLFLPAITLAAPRTFSEFAGLLVNILNAGIGVAIILGLVIYFYGIATSIPHTKEGDGERLRAHFFWGLLAIFIMVSVWGILALVRNTLFGGGGPDMNGGSGGTLCQSAADCLVTE